MKGPEDIPLWSPAILDLRAQLELDCAPLRLPLLPPPAPFDTVQARAPHPVAEFARPAARAVAEALFANEDGPADPERIEWVVTELLDFMGRAPGRARFLLTLSLFALTWVAPLFAWRFGPLSGLDVELRGTTLDRVEKSALGPAALACKVMLCLLWFEHPDTQRETRTEVTCLQG